MSGRKRRARCMKITTLGTVELNGWLTSPMGCCCRAEGHVDSRANERTNRPPSAAVARSNRGWHSRYVGFHGSFPRRTHNTPRVMGLRPRPPDDARCIRPPFPRSSIRAAQPAIWSETWYGPGTRLVPFRRLRCLAHSEGSVSLGRHFLKKRSKAKGPVPTHGRTDTSPAPFLRGFSDVTAPCFPGSRRLGGASGGLRCPVGPWWPLRVACGRGRVPWGLWGSGAAPGGHSKGPVAYSSICSRANRQAAPVAFTTPKGAP